MTSLKPDTTGCPVAITTQAQGLPQMNSAGMVRDMRAAASLDDNFAAGLTSFAAGKTRQVQHTCYCSRDHARMKNSTHSTHRKHCFQFNQSLQKESN